MAYRLIEFEDIETANRVVNSLNGMILGGRNVHLRLDRSLEIKPEGVKVFLGNIPWDASREDVMALFAEYNPLDCSISTNMMGKSRGFSILIFENEAIACDAVENMNQVEFKGRKLEVRYLVERSSTSII